MSKGKSYLCGSACFLLLFCMFKLYAGWSGFTYTHNEKLIGTKTDSGTLYQLTIAPPSGYEFVTASGHNGATASLSGGSAICKKTIALNTSNSAYFLEMGGKLRKIREAASGGGNGEEELFDWEAKAGCEPPFYIESDQTGNPKNITVAAGTSVSYSAKSGSQFQNSKWKINEISPKNDPTASSITINRSQWDVPGWFDTSIGDYPIPGVYTISGDAVAPATGNDAGTMTVVGVKQASAICNTTTIISTTNTPGNNETLYVLKGTSTITITATPEPGSSWPNGYPTFEVNSDAISSTSNSNDVKTVVTNSSVTIDGKIFALTWNSTNDAVTFTQDKTAPETEDYTGSFTVTAKCGSSEKSINVYITSIDLRIDSNNDGTIDDDDEKIEEDAGKTGKIIPINNLDKDADGIPDFADGFDCAKAGTSAAGKSHDFTEMKLIISKNLDISEFSVKFSFAESSYTVTRKGANTPGDPYYYEPPAAGQLRIWTKNGSEARMKTEVTANASPGNRVPSDVTIPLNKLFSGTASGDYLETTLYVEAVNPSASSGGNTITASLYKNDDTTAPMLSDSVKTTAVKVSAVTPDGDNPIKIMIETNPAMELLVGGVRYHTAAQTVDGKVKITATITPALKDVPVYFEVIDPDDLSPYEGKALAGNVMDASKKENHQPNDNRDPAKKISAAADYAAFQGCLSDRDKKTDKDGKAEIVLTVTNQYSGDNYIVRATCMNPGEKPFDKYTLTPPDTPATPANPGAADITNITKSLQYEPRTTIAQSALLVAWKRTYIEHAEMYKKGATVTADALAGTNILTVDNTDDFAGETKPGAGDGTEVTVFPPKDGTANFDCRVVSKTLTTITLDTPHTRKIPQYSGVKLKADNTVYTNDTSYLVKAFGGDAGGVDGGAFIEFKSVMPKINTPKYTSFGDIATRRSYIAAWTSFGNVKNTVICVAGRFCTSATTFGVTNMGIPRHVFISVDSCVTTSVLTQNVIVHEFGHVWNLTPATVPHVHGVGRSPHDNNDECVMSYGRNRNNTSPEFCMECLEYLRKKGSF